MVEGFSDKEAAIKYRWDNDFEAITLSVPFKTLGSIVRFIGMPQA
jgi:hypothetical protein